MRQRALLRSGGAPLQTGLPRGERLPERSARQCRLHRRQLHLHLHRRHPPLRGRLRGRSGLRVRRELRGVHPPPAHGQANCNHGACGFTCDEGFAPSGSSCVPGVTCHRDNDGDRVPGQATSMQVPGSSCPMGRERAPRDREFDCDDGNPNVFPGQSKYFSSAIDYDCSGTIVHSYSLTCCSYGPHGEIICRGCFLSVVVDCGSITDSQSCAEASPIGSGGCGASYDPLPACTMRGGRCVPGNSFQMATGGVLCH
jgi:hypothetical protein